MTFLRKWLPVIVWAAIILSAANDRFSDEQTAGWLERTFGVAMPRAVNVVMRKGGHVLAYAILALLAWRAHRSLAVAMLVTVAVAIADETMQAMTITREGSVWDVVLDVCGGLLAVVLVERRRK
jgi:VanZ family protein